MMPLKPQNKSKTVKRGPEPEPKKAKGNWAEVMKKALEKKRPAAGWPDQPKPRDSGTRKVKKDSI